MNKHTLRPLVALLLALNWILTCFSFPIKASAMITINTYYTSDAGNTWTLYQSLNVAKSTTYRQLKNSGLAFDGPPKELWPADALSFTGYFQDPESATYPDGFLSPFYQVDLQSDATIEQDLNLFLGFADRWVVKFTDGKGRVILTDWRYDGQKVPFFHRYGNLDLSQGRVLAGWSYDPQGQKPVYFYDEVHSDLTLYPVFLDTHLVHFDSQGGSRINYDNTHQDYALIAPGALLKKPPDPSKPGYLFGGWQYQGKSWNFAVDRVNRPLTLQAIWHKDTNPKAEVKVVVWLERPDVAKNGTVLADDENSSPADLAKHFGYYDSRILLLPVGTSLDPQSFQTNIPHSYYDFAILSSQSVQEDNSSVIHLYYKRKVYQLQFELTQSTAQMRIGNDLFGAGSPYQFLAKAGESIHERWPIRDLADFPPVTSTTDTLNFFGWSDQNQNLYPYKQIVLDESMADLAVHDTITFTSIYQEQGMLFHVNYLFQPLANDDGLGRYENYQNRNYRYDEAYNQQLFGDGYPLVLPVFPGFRAMSANALMRDQGGFVPTTQPLLDQYLFYGRKKYTLYFDTWGNLAKLALPLDQLPQRYSYYDLFYQTPLAPYAKESDRYQPVTVHKTTYQFTGWYYDLTSLHPVDFQYDQMPAESLTLYAKWIPTKQMLTMHASVRGFNYWTKGPREVEYGYVVKAEDLPQLTVGEAVYLTMDPDYRYWVVGGSPDNKEDVPMGRFVGYVTDIVHPEKEEAFNRLIIPTDPIGQVVDRDTHFYSIYNTLDFTLNFHSGEGEWKNSFNKIKTDTKTYDINHYARMPKSSDDLGELVLPAGKIFLGWKLDRNHDGMPDVNSRIYLAGELLMITEDTQVVAVYAYLNEVTQLTYHANDGSGYSRSVIVPRNSEVVLLSQQEALNPRYGYLPNGNHRFLGWDDKPNRERPQYLSKIQVKELPVDVYAHWSDSSNNPDEPPEPPIKPPQPPVNPTIPPLSATRPVYHWYLLFLMALLVGWYEKRRGGG
ncbi:MAG: InlB B-repeat-containing protein [Erysipelotrichaceae bacterium]|nr:InlB B-repeat-containing protein [Erysipelotrichaceae bacterium]